MTDDEAFRRLRTLLIEVDAESVLLEQYGEPLTDIIRDHQLGPNPIGAYGILTPTGSRDTGEGHALCYENVEFNSTPRVVELRTEGVAFGWRLDVFASRATDYIRAFRAVLLSARAQLDLLPFVISEVSEARGSAEREQEHWQGRANLTLTLSTARTQRTLIDVIERGHIAIAGIGSRSEPVTTTADFPKE